MNRLHNAKEIVIDVQYSEEQATEAERVALQELNREAVLLIERRRRGKLPQGARSENG